MTDGLEFLISGIFFGLAAATSPGPILYLVFSETLKYRRKEGIKIAVSAIIAEFPILLFVLVTLSNLIKFGHSIIGMISLFGACYLIHLGIKNLRVKTNALEVEYAREDGLKRGVIVNLLNPNPYLFWLSIGGPMIFESWDKSISATALFILGFYALLVGSNIIIALIVDKSRESFIGNRYYVYVVRALGIALILLALAFVARALEFIGIF